MIPIRPQHDRVQRDNGESNAKEDSKRTGMGKNRELHVDVVDHWVET